MADDDALLASAMRKLLKAYSPEVYAGRSADKDGWLTGSVHHWVMFESNDIEAKVTADEAAAIERVTHG